MVDDTRPSELVWVEGPSAASGLDAPNIDTGGRGSPWWPILVLLAVGGVIVASFFSARPDDDPTAAGETIVPPTTIVPASSTTTSATSSTTTTELPDPNVVAIGTALVFPVEFEDGWLAVRPSALSQLVWSADGFDWSEFDADLPPGFPLLLESVDGRLVLIVARRGQLGEGSNVQVWSSSDGSRWVLDDETVRAAVQSFGGSRAAAGNRVVVVQEADPSTVAFPELAEVLAQYIDPDQAAQVCRVEQSLDGRGGYSLLDCDGELVVEYDAASLPDAGTLLNCLNMLSFVTASHETLTVLDPVAGDIEVPLQPLQRVRGLVSTPAGFAADLVDVRDFVPFLEACMLPEAGTASGVYVWTPGSELMPVLSAEGANFSSTLTMLDDGRMLSAAETGAYVSDPPFSDWSLMAETIEADGSMSASHDGRTLFLQDWQRQRAWVAPLGGEWVEFEADREVGYFPLLGTDEYAILMVHTMTGVELRRVRYGDG